MKFWFPDIPGFYWSALFLAVIFMINAMTVKGFGESEFWFSMVKVIAIVAFIIIGLAMIIKIMLTPGVATFGNWTYKEAPFVGGLQAMIGVAMIAGFSFQGTEMVGCCWRIKRSKEDNSTCNQTDFLANLIILYPMYFHYRHPDCL